MVLMYPISYTLPFLFLAIDKTKGCLMGGQKNTYCTVEMCILFSTCISLYFLYRALRKKLKREQILLHNGCESDSEYGTTLRGNGEIAERTTTNNAMAFSLRCLPNPVLLSPLPLQKYGWFNVVLVRLFHGVSSYAYCYQCYYLYYYAMIDGLFLSLYALTQSSNTSDP